MVQWCVQAATCTFICTYRHADHAPEDVEPACRLTLKNLQLEYLDLYLIHSPSTLAKGTTSLTEENKLGYDSSRMSETWKVGDICHCDISTMPFEGTLILYFNATKKFPRQVNTNGQNT